MLCKKSKFVLLFERFLPEKGNAGSGGTLSLAACRKRAERKLLERKQRRVHRGPPFELQEGRALPAKVDAKKPPQQGEGRRVLKRGQKRRRNLGRNQWMYIETTRVRAMS